MTPEQAAAFVIAQAACALAEIASIQAIDAAQKEKLMAIQNQYCIGHNAVLQLFQDVNR